MSYFVSDSVSYSISDAAGDGDKGSPREITLIYNVYEDFSVDQTVPGREIFNKVGSWGISSSHCFHWESHLKEFAPALFYLEELNKRNFVFQKESMYWMQMLSTHLKKMNDYQSLWKLPVIV